MKILLRNAVAAMVGAIVSILLIMVGEQLAHTLVGAAGESGRSTEALVWLLVTYFIGVAAGAWVAARLSVSRHGRQGMMVGVLFFVASIANLMNLPHPVWFWVANLLLVPLAAWLGLHFGEPDERPLD